MPDRQPSPVPRRLVLSLGGGLLAAGTTALAGCGSRVAPAAGTDPAADDARAGDEAVLDQALDLTEALGARVRATLRRHPGLRGDLGGLRDLHAAHAAELRPDGEPEASDTSEREPVPARPPRARAAVLGAERAAVAAYADLAADCDSGRLARVLASVAAGLAQRVVVLDPGGDASLPRPAGLVVPADLPAEAAEALQLTLAAEHAAVWTLGVVGARTSSSGSPALYGEVDEAYGVHRARRDTVTDALRSAGEEPVAAAPSYALPDVAPSGDEAGARASALAVEDRCAGTYAYLVAGTADDVRTWAVRTLVDAALTRLSLDGDPQDLPGL